MIITYNSDFWNKIMEWRILKNFAFEKNTKYYIFDIDYEGNVTFYFKDDYLDEFNISTILEELIELKNQKEKNTLNLDFTTLCKDIEDYTYKIFERYNAYIKEKMTYDYRDAKLDIKLAHSILSLLENLEEAKLYKKVEEIK
jgi:hypothetical protein